MTQLTDNVWAVEIPEEAQDFKIDMGYLIWKTVDKSNWITDRQIEADVRQFLRTGKSRFDGADSGIKKLTGGTPLPPGQWEFICTSKDATEEDARKIVTFVQGYGYRNYLEPDYNGGSSPFDVQIPYSCKTALGSLSKLLSSKGLEGNYALLRKL